MPVPALADFMIVSNRRGSTMIERRFDGRWTRTEFNPDDISLLTRSQDSHWHWTSAVDVTHAEPAETLLSRIAEGILGRSVADVSLHDLLRVQDPTLRNLIEALSAEASRHCIGGPLSVEAPGTQLAGHMLRP